MRNKTTENSRYDETNVPSPDYQVRPVIRYIVTRYYHPYTSRDGQQVCEGSSSVIGEFDAEDIAYDVAEAMYKKEHDEVIKSRIKSAVEKGRLKNEYYYTKDKSQ